MKTMFECLCIIALLLVLAVGAQAVEYRMIDLGTLGGLSSAASGINDKGQIVGYADVESGEGYACLWDNSNIINLGTLGGNSRATDINENGWICGWLRASDDTIHAVVWQPVPEPSSIAALLCGIGGMGGILWRRKIK